MPNLIGGKMVNKALCIGLGMMLVGGILVVVGLLNVPKMAVVEVLLGGAVGFVGYKIFGQR